MLEIFRKRLSAPASSAYSTAAISNLLHKWTDRTAESLVGDGVTMAATR